MEVAILKNKLSIRTRINGVRKNKESNEVSEVKEMIRYLIREGISKAKAIEMAFEKSNLSQKMKDQIRREI